MTYQSLHRLGITLLAKMLPIIFTVSPASISIPIPLEKEAEKKKPTTKSKETNTTSSTTTTKKEEPGDDKNEKPDDVLENKDVDKDNESQANPSGKKDNNDFDWDF